MTHERICKVDGCGHPMPSGDNSTGPCETWSGAISTSGYGRRGRGYAHRWAYREHYGPIPEGMFVMHLCDNPPCVNPHHLKLGTHLDNMRDMDAKGRRVTPDRVGERNGYSRLTTEQANDIRARYAAGGVSQRALAREYGVTQACISSIVTRRTWSHV